MSPPDGLLAALLDRVPDEPRLIDFRGLLLDDPHLFGDERGAVAVRRDRTLLGVFGRPKGAILERALAAARHDAEIVAPSAARPWLEEALGAAGERAFLHAVGAQGLERRDGLPAATLLEPGTDLRHLPAALREEVEAVVSRRPVAVVAEGSRPVAFCHAALVTERYWDVSIETLAGYRRGGRATAAFFRLAEEMRAEGLEPVWGAVESNTASLRLAARVGFVRVGEMVVFE